MYSPWSFLVERKMYLSFVLNIESIRKFATVRLAEQRGDGVQQADKILRPPGPDDLVNVWGCTKYIPYKKLRVGEGDRPRA